MWKPLTIAVLGIWLLAAPFVIPSRELNIYNNWLIGVIVVNAALVMSVRRTWEKPVAAAAAIWLFMSGFVPSVLAGRSLILNDIGMALLMLIAAISAGVHLGQDLRAGYVEDPEPGHGPIDPMLRKA